MPLSFVDMGRLYESGILKSSYSRLHAVSKSEVGRSKSGGGCSKRVARRRRRPLLGELGGEGIGSDDCEWVEIPTKDDSIDFPCVTDIFERIRVQ